ncbi:MAG: hypothetical protein GXP08_11205 [Gammaproteobacteria bacterium]|nr:hypothetical protein [Gammaproteobacteria bacterium]
MPIILKFVPVPFVLVVLLSACADAARDTNNPNPISSVSVPSFITDTGDEHPGSVAISFIEDSTDTIDILLLAEDTDGDPITWTIATPPTKGGVVIDQGDSPGTSKTIHYTPNADAKDTDSFVVSIVDGTGGGNTVTVDVSIIPPSYNVSVTVSGYTTGNTLVLQNNGGDDLSLTKDGVYEFNSPVNRGTLYGVTIATPTEVIKTSCTLSNSSGTMANADITDVTVICDDNTAPKIISKAPAAGAIDVSIEPVVSVAFDEDILPTSIGSDAIDIISSTSSAGGAADYDVQSSTLSFVPTGRLDFLKPYTVVVSSNISDISGQFLESTSWSFTTRDAAWGRAEKLKTDNLIIGGVQPKISMDRTGNGFVVWTQFDGTRDNIWANRFDVKAKAWGVAELVGTSDLKAFSPEIVLDFSGNRYVVWQQSNGTGRELWANFFDVSASEWSGPRQIDAPKASSIFHRLSLNILGQALISWEVFEGTPPQKKNSASYFDLTSKTWNTIRLNVPNSQGFISDPGVAANILSHNIVLWNEANLTENNYWAIYFDSGNSSWGEPKVIVDNNQNNVML